MDFAKKIYRQKLLFSFLLCFFIGLVISAACGFRFGYFTNDDYQLSLLFAKGESHSLYVNFFLSSLMSAIQPSVPSVNVFTVLQQLCCFSSAVIIAYVILNKAGSYFGLLFSALISSYIFISDVLLIQYSQTPAVMLTAGTALAYHASMIEKNRKKKTAQIIISAIIMVISSLFRFTPFFVCSGFAILFFLCVVCSAFSKTEKTAPFKTRITCAAKKCMLLIVTAVLSFSVSLGLFIASETINSHDQNYGRFVGYNEARSRISDYETAPYYGNEEFYNSVGINSEAELILFRNDKTEYNAEVLNRIADYSEKTVQKGDSKPVYAIKNIFGSVASINDYLNLPVSGNLFAVLIFIFVIGLIALIFFVYNKKCRKKKLSLSRQIILSAIILSWLLFFNYTSFNYHNLMSLPLLALVAAAFLIDSKSNALSCLLFSVAPIGLYLYQSIFRISYRVSLAFLFPSIIFMLILTDFPKTKPIGRNALQLISYFGISAGMAAATVWCFINYYPQCTLKMDYKLRSYIENSENTFVAGVLTNACIDEGYYNSLLVPDIPKNEIMLAWSNSCNFYEADLKERQITELFPDSIDSDIRFILEGNGIISLEQQKKNYENFFNYHYFGGKHAVTFEPESIIDYRVDCDDPEKNIRELGIFKAVRTGVK